jgi:hypothetical protein
MSSDIVVPWLCLASPCRRFEPMSARCRLTLRSSGRVQNKVPSSYDGVRAVQLNRWAA